MGQIPYTLTFKLGKPNRNKECLIYLRYYSEENDVLLPSSVRIKKKYFNSGNQDRPISGHPNSAAYNVSLNNFKIEVNNRAVDPHAEITKSYLLGKSIGSTDKITDFIDEYIKLVKAQRKKEEVKGKKQKGRLSDGRLNIYRVIKNKINAFDPKATFRSVNMEWLLKLEKHIRDTGIGDNTISTNMAVVKSILNKAKDLKRINEEQFIKYIPPEYEEDIPIYLEESEINDFFETCRHIKDEITKTCGYYFLLGCYAGYRISDLFSFDYKARVKEDTIILRAKKNGKIVSIFIYNKLREVLDYCKEHSLSVTEEEMRKKVKQIAKLAGISFWKTVKVHSGRHSFAMLMLKKGLDKYEIAELLGDSLKVAERYARITNTHLHKRVKEVMK